MQQRALCIVFILLSVFHQTVTYHRFLSYFHQLQSTTSFASPSSFSSPSSFFSLQSLSSRRVDGDSSPIIDINNGEEDFYDERFRNVASLYGKDSLHRLRGSHVCVIGNPNPNPHPNYPDPSYPDPNCINYPNYLNLGLGGVGSWAAEALARSAVGSFTLIDVDDVCISNINRQIYVTKDIGGLKAHVLREKILEINPTANVHVTFDFVRKDNCDKHINSSSPFNVVVETCDGVSDKAAIIDACVRNAIPVITTG